MSVQRARMSSELVSDPFAEGRARLPMDADRVRMRLPRALRCLSSSLNSPIWMARSTMRASSVALSSRSRLTLRARSIRRSMRAISTSKWNGLGSRRRRRRHRRARRRRASTCRDQHDRNVVPLHLAADGPGQLGAAHPRHVELGEHEVDRQAVKLGDGGLRRCPPSSPESRLRKAAAPSRRDWCGSARQRGRAGVRQARDDGSASRQRYADMVNGSLTLSRTPPYGSSSTSQYR